MFDWISEWLLDLGYAGVAVLMFLENIFPPLPSEVIMPLAGFLAYQGEMSLTGVVLAGTAGSVAGTTMWFLAARRIGRRRVELLVDRHGYWLTISPEDLKRAEAWFRRHRNVAVVIGRMVPGVRTVISAPAGLSQMGFALFLALTFAGTLLWNGLMVASGYILGSQYALVAEWINPVSTVLIVGLVLLYLYRLIRQFRRRQFQ